MNISAMEDLKAMCAAISEAKMNEVGAENIQQVIDALERMKEQDPEGLEVALRQCQTNGQLDDFYSAVGMAGQGTSPSIERGLEVIPTPGFVLKTQTLSDGSKVFVNVCSSDLLPLPALKKRLDEEGNEVEGVNMPLSIGPPREVVDKSGKPCTVYDTVCHPIVLEEADADKTGAQRDELCQLILKRIEVKNAETLNPQYKLPRTSYVGTVMPQRIRDTSKDLIIEEIEAPEKGSDDPGIIGNPVSIEKKEYLSQMSPTPRSSMSYTVNGIWKGRRQDITSLSLDDTVEESHEKWPSWMEVDLVGLSPQDCTLENTAKLHVKVSPFEACIDVAGYNSVSVLFPFVTLPRTAVCELNPHENVLVLRVRVDLRPVYAGPDPGSHPWMLSHALSGGNAHQDVNLAQSEMDSKPRELQPNSIIYGDDDKAHDAFQEHRFNVGRGGALHENSFPRDSGLATDEKEVLPEDKFHQKDAVSRYILQQRQHEQQHKPKDEYSAKEDLEKQRQRGAANPRIEYIDVNQFEDKLVPNDANVEGKDETLFLSSEKASSKLKQVVGNHSLESKLWTTLL